MEGEVGDGDEFGAGDTDAIFERTKLRDRKKRKKSRLTHTELNLPMKLIQSAYFAR